MLPLYIYKLVYKNNFSKIKFESLIIRLVNSNIYFSLKIHCTFSPINTLLNYIENICFVNDPFLFAISANVP